MTCTLNRLFLTLLSLCLAAFSSAAPALANAASPSKSRLDQIIKSGELRIGLTGNQAPLNMTNKDGEVIGLEVDLINALANQVMALDPSYGT